MQLQKHWNFTLNIFSVGKFIPFELALEVRGKYRTTVFATDRNSALAKADGNCACAYFGELEDYTWDDPIV